MRNNQCAGLHQGVVSCASPAVHNVILVLVCVDYAVNAACCIAPVSGDFCIDNSSAQGCVCVAVILCPVVGAAGILAVFCQIIVLLGCQIHPASCPGDIVLYILVRVGALLIGHLPVLCSEVIECGCIGQIFFSAGDDVVLCQRRSILCCNVAGAICNRVGFAAVTIPHFFRCIPGTVILAVVSHFIDEGGDLSAGKCGRSLEEVAEFVHDQLVVLHGAGLDKLILILIAHPAQCRSRKSGSQAAFNGVSGIVKAAFYCVTGMAGTAPGESGVFCCAAAHIGIIKIQGIL